MADDNKVSTFRSATPAAAAGKKEEQPAIVVDVVTNGKPVYEAVRPVLLDVFTRLMRHLHALVRDEFPDKAAGVQHDLSGFYTKLESGEPVQNGFDFGFICEKILAQHLDAPEHIRRVQNEAKSLVEREMAQEQSPLSKQIAALVKFMGILNRLVSEQFPGKAAVVQRALKILQTQLESGETKPDGFDKAITKILSTHLDAAGASIKNKARAFIEMEIAQRDKAQQQQQIQPRQGVSRAGEAGDSVNAPKADTSQLKAAAPLLSMKNEMPSVKTPSNWKKEDESTVDETARQAPRSNSTPLPARQTGNGIEFPLLHENTRRNELYMAALDGQEIAVKRLLKAGMDPNSGQLIRIDGAEHLDYPLIVAAKAGFLKICELLLKHGANPSLKKAAGYNSLYNACTGGHLKVVKLLLAAGVDPNITLDSGYTPLIIAAEANFFQ